MHIPKDSLIVELIIKIIDEMHVNVDENCKNKLMIYTLHRIKITFYRRYACLTPILAYIYSSSLSPKSLKKNFNPFDRALRSKHPSKF